MTEIERKYKTNLMTEATPLADSPSNRGFRQIPAFFTEIAACSTRRWEQLEADPGLAAPWRSLFQQVDSPRHVLSELLQNAEDAKATWARCEIINKEFIFEHNGQDFDPATLGSLCEFAYSNKRTLHTIGFRGIGFKTTFSLGSVVTVETPTLAFRFDHLQFTLPVWMEDAEPLSHTRIRVQMKDDRRCAALAENLEEWLQSPVPLLFFNCLESLEISKIRIEKEVLGPGPVEGSEWVLLKSDHPLRVLKITTDTGEMPPDVVEEIRNARNDNNFEPAACSLDLILGLPENRVYTILPTQVMPQLPFSCNAPFLQEPSRVRILDPAFSPTNRWLLERAAWTAANALIEWISDENATMETRIHGYDLLPKAAATPLTALDGAVRGIIIHELEEWLKPCDCLISQDGVLSSVTACADIPRDFVEAWGAETAIALLGGGKETCLHVSVPDNTRENLIAWRFLEERDDAALKDILAEAETLPRPATNERLVQLWSAIEELLGESIYYWRREPCVYPMVPALGSDILYRPKDICRTMAQSEALSRDDYALLYQMVKIADGAFLELLEATISDGNVPVHISPIPPEQLGRAKALLDRCALESWSLPRVFEAACNVVFHSKSTREARFRLTRIAITADLSAADAGLTFLCRDDSWRRPNRVLIYTDGVYDDLLPEEWASQFCVSKAYEMLLPEEESSAANRWLKSAKSGLCLFPAPHTTLVKLGGKHTVTAEAARRGGTHPDFWGATNRWDFDLNDYDWDDELVAYWEEIACDDETVWVRVVTASAHAWGPLATSLSVARIDRPRGAARYSVSEGLTAAWLMRLRSLPCLPDDKFNQPELPDTLLYRTPETEPLLNIEKFVHRTLDTALTKPLLELLGVRSKPRSAERIMDRLVALAEAEKPPLTHVLDLYRALDGLFDQLDTEGRASIQEKFDVSPLIYDHEGVWRRRLDVCQANEEELAGIAIIHPEMRSLSLWDRLQVDRSPSTDRILAWLHGLPSRSEIVAVDRKRIVAILGRTPRLVYDTTHHWLSRAGTWAPWDELRFFIESRVGDGAGDGVLFPHIRRQIADLSMLKPEQIEGLKDHLRPLGEVLTQEVEAKNPRACAAPEWVQALAVGFLRAQPADEADAQSPEIAEIADDLQAIDLYYSTFQEAQGIRTVPFLDGVQVGTPVTTRALWQDRALTVVGAEHSYHRSLVEQLQRRFVFRGFRQAIGDCVGRDASWISGYFEDNFSLCPSEDAERELGLATIVVSGTDIPPTSGVHHSDHSSRNGYHSDPDEAQEASESDSSSLENDASQELDGAKIAEDQDDQNKIGDYSSLEDHTDDVDEKQPHYSASGARRATQRQSPLAAYLMSQGFVYDEDRQLYSRSNDNTIVRREVGSDYFTQYTVDGEEEAQYWEYAASVSDGVLIPAHVWLYLEQRHSQCSLIMYGLDGKPLAITAEALMRWKEQQFLTVSAASYRIKLTVDWAALPL